VPERKNKGEEVKLEDEIHEISRIGGIGKKAGKNLIPKDVRIDTRAIRGKRD